MDILHLIDQLEEMVAQARRLPVGGNLVLDRKRVLDLVDQMRIAIPKDVKDASDLVTRREQFLAEADAEAGKLLKAAEQEAERRLSTNEIVQSADDKADAIIAAAREQAHQIVREADATAAAHLSEAADAAGRQVDEADSYALEVLTRLERQVGAFMKSIRAGIDSIERQREAEQTSRNLPRDRQ